MQPTTPAQPDYIGLGNSLKAQYPQYAAMDSGTLGLKYAQKYGITPAPAQSVATTTPTPSAPSSTNTQTPTQSDNSGGVLGGIFSALTQPIVKAAGTVAEGVKSAGDIVNNWNQVSKGHSFWDVLTGNGNQNSIPNEQPTFITPQEQQNIESNPVKEALKTTAGVGSYMVPGVEGAGAVGGAVLRGLESGALYGVGQDNSTPESVAESALGGAAVGGVLGVGSKLLGQGTNAIADTASQNLTKVTPATMANAIADHGVNINDLAQKYITTPGNYDDFLGPVSARGNGGIIGSQLQTAENTIQNTIKDSGSNIIATVRDLKAPLQAQIDALGQTVGNQDKISALQDMMKEIDAKYSSGLTAQDLLDLKRAGDSTFGKSVVEDTKGSVTTQTQKMLANTARGILKTEFPAISDALGTQSDLLTLQPVLNKARAIDITNGTDLSKIDLTKPGSWVAPVMDNPNVSSAIQQVGTDIPSGEVPPTGSASPNPDNSGNPLGNIFDNTKSTVGGAIDSLNLPPTSQIVGDQLGAVAGGSISGGGNPQPDTSILNAPTTPGSNSNQPPNNPNGPSKATIDAQIEQALQTGNLKNATALEAYSAYLYPKASAKVNQPSDQEINGYLGLLDKTLGKFNSTNFIDRINPLNPTTRYVDTQKLLLVEALQKLNLSRVTQTEIQLGLKQLFRPYDSPAVAQAAVDAFKDNLKAKLQNPNAYADPNSTTSTTPDTGMSSVFSNNNAVVNAP